MKISLTNKFTALFILAISVTSVIQGTSSYFDILDQTTDSLYDYSAAMLDVSSDGVNSWLAMSKDIISSIDNNDFSDKKIIREALEQVTQAGKFKAAYLALPDGTFIPNTSVKGVPDDYDPRGRDWYKTTITSSDKFNYSAPYRSADSSSKEIVVSITTKYLNRPTTVLGADLSLNALTYVVKSMQTRLAYGMLVSKEGKIIAHPDETLLMKDIKELNPSMTLDFLKQSNYEGDGGKLSMNELVINSKKSLISSYVLKTTGWYVVVIIDKKLAYKKANDSGMQSIFFAMGMMISIIVCLIFILRRMFQNLLKTNTAIAELSKGEGDLTLRLSSKGSDEVAELAGNVNLFIAKLHTIISEIVSSGQKVREQSLAFTDMAQQSQESLASQKDEVSQIATAVNEMSATAQEVANNAEATASATVMSSEHCAKGKTVILHNRESITGLANKIDETSQAMGELEANTQNINNILLSIQGIAEQTNLLALNAAIEAARAGEQGRGFAVVADEVRVLSQRTQGSTEEIRVMIETLLENTDNAVRTMQESRVLTDQSVEQANDAVTALAEISDSIKKIADMSTQIASAAEEQRAVTEEVNRNTQSVSNSSDQMVLAAGDILEMSTQLGDVANGLNEQVGLFKL